MGDEELTAWVCDLIARRVPESHDLDYKATLKVDTRPDRLELAKDVSSFANERGGTILYGIPEDASGEAPVPQEFAACGMAIPPGLPETVENVLVETVDPPLPECVVRVVSIGDAPDKRVLLAFHPVSWNRPHMTLYKDSRYYRRGNFRAVVMGERDVEAAYFTRRATSTAAREFLTTADFGVLPREGIFIRVIVCPHLSLVRREVMRERQFRGWLDANLPGGRRGCWVPFLDGWRFPSYAGGSLEGRQFEVRLFHSGATACTSEMDTLFRGGLSKETESLLWLPRTAEHLDRYVLEPASKAFELLGVSGAVTVRVSVHGLAGQRAVDWTAGWIASAEENEPSAPLGRDFSFEEESSATEIQFAREAVLDRIIGRFAAAFGMWRRGPNEYGR
jgi:Schlafen, AlbA_2